MSFLRSVLFSTPLIALATIVMGTLSLIASLFDYTGRVQHRIARVWARMLLLVSFIRVRGEGLEKLDRNASYVFVANHTSFMDIPAILWLIDVQFRFFAKKGLFRIPFLGTHLKRAGHIPVDRDSPRASLKSMTRGAEIIAREGISMLLFPEGGRTAVGEGCANSTKAPPTSRSRPECRWCRWPSWGCGTCCRWARATCARAAPCSASATPSQPGA